jgi:hypothetical protein
VTITATAFGGNTANAATVNINPGSATSSTGDRIVVVYCWSDSGNSASQNAGTVTSTPAKTFTKDTDFVGTTAIGLAVYSWVSDGTTLTQVALAPNGTSVGGVGGTTIKLASGVGTVTYDSTTKGTGTDATSPLAWSAGGAISGTQVGLTLVGINNGADGTFTVSTGYTDAFNEGHGSLTLVHDYEFKTGETGTPSLSIAYSAAITSAKEMFVSFKEPASGLVAPAHNLIYQALDTAYNW